jgi:hypothetical protein
MLSVIVLICSISTQPSDCGASRALQSLSGGEARSFQACGLQAQAILASSALKPAPEREYAKIECVPKKAGKV